MSVDSMPKYYNTKSKITLLICQKVVLKTKIWDVQNLCFVNDIVLVYDFFPETLSMGRKLAHNTERFEVF